MSSGGHPSLASCVSLPEAVLSGSSDSNNIRLCRASHGILPVLSGTSVYVSAAYRRPRGVSVPLAGEVQVRIDPPYIQSRNPSCSESHSPSIWGGCVSYPSNFCPVVVRSWENFDFPQLDGSSPTLSSRFVT